MLLLLLKSSYQAFSTKILYVFLVYPVTQFMSIRYEYHSHFRKISQFLTCRFRSTKSRYCHERILFSNQYNLLYKRQHRVGYSDVYVFTTALYQNTGMHYL
jgi:hypothetical protein